MSKRIYVGNLNYTTNEEKINELFAAYGEVTSATIIYDRDTQQSKGFGFVEMADDGAALRAISELSGKEVDGRKIRVNEAEERRERDGAGRSNRGFGERRDSGRDFNRGYGDRGNFGNRGYGNRGSNRDSNRDYRGGNRSGYGAGRYRNDNQENSSHSNEY